jgi:hypothetical protein
MHGRGFFSIDIKGDFVKRLFIIPVFVFSLMPFCFSEDYTHIVEKSKVIEQSASSQRMTEQLNQAAGMYVKIGKVARIGIYDFAFGSSIEEYKKLNSYGVIMITVQCHDKDELPLKDVYFKAGKKRYSLTFLFSKQVKTLGDAAEKVFGKNRNHSFYLLPYMFTRTAGEVCVDWGKNRKGFIVAKFPAVMKLDFITAKKDMIPDKKNSIDAETLGKFLEREFSFSAGEQAIALKNLKK